ncbi:MAG: quinone oxidoreductase family protein [Deltaproteobacteria bacterium]
MKAAVLRSIGRSPGFEEFAEPRPQEGEVLVQVLAASLKPIDKQLANGTHYASPRNLPVICGTDGVGRLADGTRVFFGGPRRPYGSMAPRTVVPRAFCFPIPEGVSDESAAALINPGVSAWLSLSHKTKIAQGETVLILGATGIAGRLAVQIAKLLGAGRVIASGRNEQALNALLSLGADILVPLGSSDEEVKDAFHQAAGDQGFDVIIDYLWGRPTELLLSAMTRTEFARFIKQTRLLQVGETAGPAISLPAAALRSIPLVISGTGGIPPQNVLVDAVQQVFNLAAQGKLAVNTEQVSLADIESAWQWETESGLRLVIVP